MTSRNLVSAIVVNYNGAAFIEQCLDSLSREKCVREIIVVDNGSTDGSADAIAARRRAKCWDDTMRRPTPLRRATPMLKWPRCSTLS